MGKFKIICILFVIMVSLMTFSFTQDKKIDKENIVTQDDIENYKQTVINSYNKHGWYLSEKELNESIQQHIDSEISTAEIKAKGMEFGEALKTSLITSAICFAAFGIMSFFITAHRMELNPWRRR